MATDYALNLKATLDTSDVQQKLQTLGQVGTQSFDSLEKAVKDLDNSLKQVVQTMQRAQQAPAAADASAGRLLRLGSRYVGGQLLGAAGQYFDRNGNASGALLANVGGGSLQGAAAGMALGPYGAGIGAVIGAAVPIFKQLAEEASSTSSALAALSEKAVALKASMGEEASNVGARQRLREIAGLSNVELLARRSQNAAAVARYEAYATGDVDYGDATVEERKATLEALKEAASRAEAEIAAIDKTLDARDKEAEAAKKLADSEKKLAEAQALQAQKAVEAVQGRAGEALSKFGRARELEAFSEQVQNMSPADLQETVQALKNARAAAGGAYAGALSKAAQSGSAEDISRAEELGTQFDDLTAKLRASTGALESISKIDIAEAGPASLLRQVSGSTASTLASKGYDVGGYGKPFEQQALDQAVTQTMKIEAQTNATKAVQVTAQQIYTLLQRQMINNGGLEGGTAVWGS